MKDLQFNYSPSNDIASKTLQNKYKSKLNAAEMKVLRKMADKIKLDHARNDKTGTYNQKDKKRQLECIENGHKHYSERKYLRLELEQIKSREHGK